jgi:hypothetical protein
MAESDVPYGFAKPLAIKVRNNARQQGQTGARTAKSFKNRVTAIAKAPVGGIPARSGNTPGSAVCSLVSIETGPTLTVGSVQETVYNISATAVSANTWIFINREYITGKWVVVMESCEAV